MHQPTRQLLLTYPAKYIKRDGNQTIWTVRLAPGDIVTVRTHCMCTEKTAIKVALRQRDARTPRVPVWSEFYGTQVR